MYIGVAVRVLVWDNSISVIEHQLNSAPWDVVVVVPVLESPSPPPSRVNLSVILAYKHMYIGSQLLVTHDGFEHVLCIF